jgi:hypothetical protein
MLLPPVLGEICHLKLLRNWPSWGLATKVIGSGKSPGSSENSTNVGNDFEFKIQSLKTTKR